MTPRRLDSQITPSSRSGDLLTAQSQLEVRNREVMAHNLPLTHNLDKDTIVPFGTMRRGISAIAFEGDNVMRSIFLAITTVLTVSFATAVLGVGLAAPASAATMSKSTQAK